MSTRHRVAIWMSEKKSQKFNWSLLHTASQKYNLDLFKVDLKRDLHSQGKMSIFLHKLTDIIATADEGDVNGLKILNNIQSYLHSYPKTVVIDPINNIRRLLDRFRCYSIINQINFASSKVFTPTFCEISSSTSIADDLRQANVTYPFICKHRLGHGSQKSHEMFIVFNEGSLKDCEPNSVVQSFINHNAVLYKIFVIGDHYHCVERPSIKNLYAGDFEPIHFDSGQISKASSQNQLTILDDDEPQATKSLNPQTVKLIVESVRSAFELDLVGIDFVIDNDSGKYAIIDINVFPGYDGFPNYYDTLLRFISTKLPAYTEDCDCTKKCDCIQSSSTITSLHDVINR